jgi:formamidopyrimidine-DNA glycosylase
VPELVEVEYYRRAALSLTGALIERAEVLDARFLRGTTPRRFRQALGGERITALERTGKLLCLRTTGPTLGLRFGMTGIVLVDGTDALDDELMYGPRRRDPAWERLRLVTPQGTLVVSDPRILGSAELDPDEDALGPDATAITLAQLRSALAGSATPLKARLLDQSRVAGVGNLIADEVCWRSSLAPTRPAGSLSPADSRRLHQHLRTTVADLLERGGSHRGRLVPERRAGGTCPKDGATLLRSTVGGRTTWWCPVHQRT